MASRKGSKANKRSRKVRKSQRKSQRKGQRKSQRRSQKQQRGGGYSEVLNNSIYPGQQIHQQYSGPGYDCPGIPTRPGTLTDEQMIPLRIAGLPGLQKGGGSCGLTAQDMMQQAQQLGSGGPAILGVNVDAGARPGAYSASLDAPAQPLPPTPALYSQLRGGSRKKGKGKRRQQKQQGGRWGAFPELGNLNQQNGVGTIGSPFLRQPCELGSYNPSLPNPGNVQQLSTAQGWVPGWTPYAPALKGGAKRVAKQYAELKKKSNDPRNPVKVLPSRMNVHRNAPTRRGRKQQGGMTNFQQYPQVQVGAADSMRIYSPTAGYDNRPMSPQVPNNPGILMQLGYPAGHLNEACIKTN